MERDLVNGGCYIEGAVIALSLTYRTELSRRRKFLFGVEATWVFYSR